VVRRRAERLLGRFAPAVGAGGALDAVPASRLALANGSNLEEALSLAGNLLAGTAAPARIVVFTDARMRHAFTPDLAVAALAAAPRGTVVHIVERTPGDGDLSEYRDDEHALARVAAAYGGMAVALSGGAADAAAVARTMLALVRPVRIDGFAIEGATFADVRWNQAGDSALREGVGVRLMALVKGAPATVRLSGKIWGRVWSRTVAVDGDLAARLPTLVFGDDLHGALEEDEQRMAARAGRAISPVTSYLASERDARPVVDDLDPGRGFGISGTSGTCGGCSIGSSSRCGGSIGVGGGVREPPRHGELLRDWLTPAVQACARAHRATTVAAAIRVEATGDEIVDVHVEGAATAALAECIADAAWEVRLSSEFSAAHQTYPTAVRVEL